MKILIYSNPNLLDYDLPLVRALQNKGLDVTYLVEMDYKGTNSTLLSIKDGHAINGIEPASAYPEFAIFSSYLDLNKVYVRNYYKKHKIPFVDKLILSLKCFRFLKKNKFDIIQRTQVFFSTDIIMYYFRKSIIKIVHDPFPHSGDLMKGWTKFYYNLGMKIIPRFVVLNRTQYHQFCDVYNKKEENVLLSSLGIYDCYNLFNSDGLKPRKNNILFFGRISKYKGVEYLCEAMELVRHKIPDVTLTIVGGEKYYFDIDKYKKIDGFEFINRYVSAQELSGFLNECTIVVCPYTDSTQSGVVMTAFSHGKPIIASEVGGLAEQIENGESGILVPPRNSEKLSEAIIELLQNHQLYRHIKEYINYEYNTGRRSWDFISNQYIDFYKK